MRWKQPPSNMDYQLVATRKTDNDIMCSMILPMAGEIPWSQVNRITDPGLKEYLLSMKQEIEAGAYDLELMEKEIKNIELEMEMDIDMMPIRIK
ncbi:hypothetical protein GLW20_01725 [Virgibacillus halodenitrificans]|nr:hypothetical protein [Virgibacillus halodenitrificans]